MHLSDDFDAKTRPIRFVAALGITRSTVQKHINNLKRAGRLSRIGPDKGGHWEVVEGEGAR